MKKGVDALIFNDSLSAGGFFTRTAGAYRVATHLRQQGYKVQVIDLWSYIVLEGTELLELILEKFIGSNTIFVGFSSTFFTWKLPQMLGVLNTKKGSYYTRHVDDNVFSAELSRIEFIRNTVKRINPKTDLMLGGARASVGAPFMDVVLFGYAEEQLTEYVKWRKNKNPFFQFRKEGDQIIIDSNVKSEGLDFSKTQIRWEKEDCLAWGETLPIEISRGCIFSCKFCSFPLNGKTKLDYLKDIDVLRDELTRNYELYGVTKYVFSDDTYNDTTTKLEELSAFFMSLPFKISFGAYGRLDLINAHPEQIDLLEESGCTALTFGIESMNRKAASSIGKGGDPEKLVETLYKCQEKWGSKIHTSSGFIIGLPYDTYKEMDRWLTRVTDSRFPLHNTMYVPLGIVNKNKTQKRFLSFIDKNPEALGYRLTEHDAWVNDTYETDFHNCCKIAADVNHYINQRGRDSFGAHVLIGVEDELITREKVIAMGVYGLQKTYTLLDKTHLRYLNYLQAIFDLAVD